MNWIKLVNYGEFPHEKGLQRISPHSAKKIVESFYSVRGLVLRKFCGLPVYIGHPDDEDTQHYSSKTSYGKINDLKCDSNGVWMSIDWSDLGSKIFSNGMLKYFSPRWLMKEVEYGIFEPQRLLSVGLTNRPNIKCDHKCICEDAIDYDLLKKIFAILGVTQDASNDEILAKITKLQDEQLEAKKVPDLYNHTAETIYTTKESDENITINPSTVSGGNSGENCKNNKTENKENKVKLNTESKTNELVNRHEEVSIKDRILKIVYDRMSLMNEPYHTAWANAKVQFPELFK